MSNLPCGLIESHKEPHLADIFHMLTQGNFIVPSSREAVDSNSVWNEELRGHLPQLFCRALSFFKALPAEDNLLWVNRWLHCIPLQGEVT